MKTRLGLDIGTNSIGWSLIKLDKEEKPVDIIKTGVRIFSDGRDPKTYSTKNSERRGARLRRRQRDRYLQRRKYLMNFMIKEDLMPQQEDERKKLQLLNPWKLRAEALERKLTSGELGRVFFHINQRRGFKSNRKTDKGEDAGVVKQSINEFKDKMKGAKTVGEYLYSAHQKGEPVRARRRGTKTKDLYDFYTDRHMLKDEFNKICEKQISLGHETLTKQLQKKLFDIIFWQRDLKPPIVGKCSVYPKEDRAPRALISFQKFRLWQSINTLRMSINSHDKEIPIEVKQELFKKIFSKKSMTIGSIENFLKKECAKDGDRVKINYNTPGAKKSFKGNELINEFKQIKKNDNELTTEEQDELILKLDETVKENGKRRYLYDSELKEWVESKNLSPVDYIVNELEQKLPDGHSMLSYRAIKELIVHLEKGLGYDEALQELLKNNPNANSVGKRYDTLPCYQKILDHYTAHIKDDCDEKRISNPTVHIALNQLRLVVNDIISRFKKPEQIVIELARDLPMGAKSKGEHISRQNKNKTDNKRINEELKKLGQTPNRDNRIKYKLWEELGADKLCPFSGKKIGASDLFSPKFEVEHILPYAKTLDDSFANKTLCLAQENRYKGKRSPYEAYGSDDNKYSDILTRIENSNMYQGKKNKFKKGAMERFDDEGGFLERHLNDTRYISRAAKQYLECLYDKNNSNVWVVTGKLTAHLRHHWGCNIFGGQKVRDDHRHHAIDATVVALTERSIIQRVSTICSRRAEKEGLDILKNYPAPYENLVTDLENSIGQIIVSHKPTRNYEGQIHKEKAYGILDKTPNKKGEYKVRLYQELSTIDKKNEIEGVVDDRLREELIKSRQDGTEEEFKERNNVRKLRVQSEKSVIPVDDGKKGFIGGSNWAFDIYEKEDGSWGKYVISTFEIYQHMSQKPKDETKDTRLKKYLPWEVKNPGAKLVARLHRNDLFSLIEDDQLKIYKVQKIDSIGRICRVRHHSSDVKEANQKGNTLGSMKLLKEKQFKKIHISPAGFYSKAYENNDSSEEFHSAMANS